MAARRRCPQCGAPVQSPVARPFCSARCRTLDLGKWLDQRYVIASEPVDREHFTEQAPTSTEDTSCD